MAPKANVILVKEYLSQDVSKPPQLAEMNEFWKSCSTEERQRFADEVRRVAPELDPVTATA